MSALDAYRTVLADTFAELAGEIGVPGAVCGVGHGDETAVVTWGVTNVATGEPVQPGTLFQLGSITKLYTATLVMQAAGAGVVSLDDSVRSQLQEFTVADPAATIEITPRHLLTHTSGLEGDHLIDTGWNPDAVARYVATLAGLGQIHPTDETWSFCNTGYGVAGRLLEVATGEHFDRVLRRRLTRPLGCRSTLTLPHEALLHSVAVGHTQTPAQPAGRQQHWPLRRSAGPMGGVLAPVDELLAFVRMHLAGGRAHDGEHVLAPADVEEMQEPYVETPVPGESQGLGWTIRRWDDLTCLGQDADTFGQRALLRVVPARDFAVCVLGNSPLVAALAAAVIERIASDLLGVSTAAVYPAGSETASASGSAPATASGDATAVALAEVAGTYDRLHHRVVATAGDGGLDLSTEPSGVLRALGVTGTAFRLEPLGPVDEAGRLAVAGVDPTTGTREVAVFTPASETLPASLHLGGRLHRRTA
jgi:CubicO group peptidase (beta-lactamase class C family)